MCLLLLPRLRSPQPFSTLPLCSLDIQHLHLLMLGLQELLLRLPRLRPLSRPVQGLAGFRPYPQTALQLQLPAQGLAGHRPLRFVLQPFRRGREEPVGLLILRLLPAQGLAGYRPL